MKIEDRIRMSSVPHVDPGVVPCECENYSIAQKLVGLLREMLEYDINHIYQCPAYAFDDSDDPELCTCGFTKKLEQVYAYLDGET